MARRIIVLVLLIILALFNYLNFSQYLTPGYASILTPIGKFYFSNICHLQENKLFQIDEFATVLCSRCSGIYLGALFVATTLLFVDIRLNFRFVYLFAALLPTVFDIIFYNIGLYSYNIFISLFAGILSGVFGFYYFYTGILNIYLSKKKE